MILKGFGLFRRGTFGATFTALPLALTCAVILSGCDSLPVRGSQDSSTEVEVSDSSPPVDAPDTPAADTVVDMPEIKQAEVLPCPEPAPTPPLQACPAPPKPKPCPRCPAAVVADKFIMGEMEEVTVSPPGFKYTARIDTGAEGTSVHATNVVRFERDGDSWVRFELENPKSGAPQTFERELVRRVRVKQVELDGFERRLVVMLELTIGQITGLTEVSLVDRSGMEYPVLIGRNFLQNQAVVDVSQKFIAH